MVITNPCLTWKIIILAYQRFEFWRMGSDCQWHQVLCNTQPNLRFLGRAQFAGGPPQWSSTGFKKKKIRHQATKRVLWTFWDLLQYDICWKVHGQRNLRSLYFKAYHLFNLRSFYFKAYHPPFNLRSLYFKAYPIYLICSPSISRLNTLYLICGPSISRLNTLYLICGPSISRLTTLYLICGPSISRLTTLYLKMCNVTVTTFTWLTLVSIYPLHANTVFLSHLMYLRTGPWKWTRSSGGGVFTVT